MKKEVKIILKKNKITQTELAEKLYISRPTLAAYIDIFERGKKIPNDKYDFVFSNLFGGEIESKKEFKEELARFSNLLQRDMDLGTFELSTDNTDLLMKTYKNLTEYMKEYQDNKEVFELINILINKNTKDASIFKLISRYFLFLNCYIDLDKMTNADKIFISNFFKVMDQAKNNKLAFDEDSYIAFSNRVEYNQKKREKKVDSDVEKLYEAEIKERLKTKIYERMNEGVDLEDVDMDEILKEIIEQE